MGEVVKHSNNTGKKNVILSTVRNTVQKFSDKIGVATHDFPNFLILFGPNVLALWSSLIRTLEIQAQYNGLVIEALKIRNADGNKFAMMPKADVEKEYTESLQPELSKLAMSWNYGCRSYYTNSKGRNTVMYPWRQSYYEKRTRRIEWKNYVVLVREAGGKVTTSRNGEE